MKYDARNPKQRQILKIKIIQTKISRISICGHFDLFIGRDGSIF